ncbi:MAG: AAA family ATPase, partial [Planctomycetota bacterium]
PEPRARPSPQTPGQEQQAEPSAAPWPLITDVAVILAHAQPRPKVIVENLIYAGSKVSFSGPSKARKTFFQLHFCLCVALGREWYGLATTQGRVLYVNLELHPFSFQDRVQAILKRLDATLPEGVLDVWHLRGLGVTIERLQSELARRVQQDSYSLLCFDPLYKCLGARSENSAAEMGDLLIRLEGIGHSAGAATLVSHHYSKGLASGKEAIDRSSGSGVVGRDGDAILMLTPHEADDCFTLEAIVRDFPPLAPFVLRWNYPCFEPDQRLDPKNLKKQVSSQPRVTQEDVLAVVTSTPATRENIVQALMKRTGRGENACRAAFTQAETANLLQVEKLPRKGNRPILRYFK